MASSVALVTLLHLVCLLLVRVDAAQENCVENDQTLQNESTAPTFLAATYQHAVHNWILSNSTQQEALALMNKNLDVYETQIQLASSKGVSMIVFPEYGITGFQLFEISVRPFLEFVPNPYQHPVIPCIQPEFKTSPILQRLSCLARKHSIVIVANLATKMPCERSSQDPDCPSGGEYRHNTDVALGVDGKLIAKYNKENLYSEELDIFQPGKGLDNLAVFETDFGVFGLFTCFDMLFKDPGERLVVSMGVTNMVFPTAWGNELPLLSAVEYQEAWAISHDVNLLAANIQLPLLLMTGGGLFAGARGAVTYHHDMTDFKGALLIGELPVRSLRHPEINTKAFKELSSNFHKLSSEDAKMISPVARTILKDTEPHVMKTPQCMTHDSISSPSSMDSVPSSTPFTKEIPFSSMMNHDSYTFVLLTQNVGRASVCSGPLCCHLNYTFGMSSGKRGMFALGVFNGLHTNNGQYYVQTCALVKCKSEDQASCGAQTVQSDTPMESFSLGMVGFDNGTRLFPSVLTTDVRLATVGLDWVTEYPFDHIRSKRRITDSLLVASIFGRCYQKDAT